MAPNPLDTVDENLKRTIQSLYALQSSTHGYLGPETHAALVAEVQTLSRSLTSLQTYGQHPASTSSPPLPVPGQASLSLDPLAALATPSNAPQDSSTAILPALLPPEVINYVDTGRNPDIYTREFVELVQRGNAYLKGKSEGLRTLRDYLGEEIVEAWPEMRGEVQKVLGGAAAGSGAAAAAGHGQEGGGLKREQGPTGEISGGSGSGEEKKDAGEKMEVEVKTEAGAEGERKVTA